MSEQRVPFSVRDEAKDGLTDWWSDRWDTWFFNQIAGNTGEARAKYYGFNAPVAPDADHVTYASSGSTSDVSISNSTVSQFSLKWIDTAVEKAKLAKNALRPLNVGGRKKYVAFIHPYQVTALRTAAGDSQWRDIQLAAIQGGKISDNPIYTGAIGEYNNVVLHESTRVPVSPTNASVRRAVLCGAQAACVAFGRKYSKNTFTWVEELFDYKNKLGVAAGCQAGMVKTRFDNSDYGTVVMPTWATASN